MAGWSWRQTPLWQDLDPAGRLALMGLLEADRGRDHAAYLNSAANTIHANINRAQKLGWDTDRVLNFKAPGKSYGWFQPLDEPAQYARASRLLNSPEYKQLYTQAQARLSGEAGDNVAGATHYRAHDDVMLALSKKEPDKYRVSSWASWSPPGSHLYKDSSHSFYAPEGRAVTTPAAATAPAAEVNAPAVAARPSAPTTAMAPAARPQNDGVSFFSALAQSLRSMGQRQAPQFDEIPLQLAKPQENKILPADQEPPQFVMFGAPA